MKNENHIDKINRKKQIKTWLIRIFALVLVALMILGSAYYTIWALFL